MKAQLNDFVPGRILYHVYGINRTNTIVSESEINKIIVISNPYPIKVSGEDCLFVNTINCFINHNWEEESFRIEASLNDMGVDTGLNRKVHNLNRVFTSKEAAMKFLAELRDDNFSDPIDQEYAKGYTPERQEEDRLMVMAAYESYDDDYYFG